MKKLALLMVLVMVCSVVFADNFEKLQTAHKNAMKFYGRAELLSQRDAKLITVQANRNDVASLLMTNELVTGYMETEGNRKIYWEVIPIEGGAKIVIKINILGKVYEKTIIVKFGEQEMTFSADSNDRDAMCLIKCAGNAALGCAYCLINKVCWIACLGTSSPSIISCVMGCF